MRTFLLLVLGLPTLMPPGMCVCQLVPCRSGETQGLPALETALVTAPPDTKRCCCPGRRLKAESGDTTLADAPKSAPSPAKSPPHSPRPTEHAPNCPALTGGSLVTAVLPVVALDLAFADVGIYTSLPTAREVRAVLSDRLSSYGTSPPVYLAHCSLVI